MLKNFLNLSLATTLILGSLSTLSYAQQPTSAPTENYIPQTPIQLDSNAPSIITEGFEAYCSGENKNPLAIWSQHMMPLLSETLGSNQVDGNMMNVMENLFGKCIGYSIIGSHPFTEKTQIVYFESDHENSPLFWKFTVYQSPKGLVISGFNSSTDASQIIPPNVLIGG